MKEMKNLEQLTLAEQFRIQENLWSSMQIHSIAEDEKVHARDLETVLEIQAAQRPLIPPDADVAGCFPWTLSSRLLENRRIRDVGKTVAATLRKPILFNRRMMSIPPVITEVGLKLEDALCILWLLPAESAGAGWTVTVRCGPADYLEHPQYREDILKMIVGKKMSVDFILADDVRTTEKEIRVSMTRGDVEGSPDYAASLMAMAITTVTHHRALSLMHARAYGSQRADRSENSP